MSKELFKRVNLFDPVTPVELSELRCIVARLVAEQNLVVCRGVNTGSLVVVPKNEASLLCGKEDV